MSEFKQEYQCVFQDNGKAVEYAFAYLKETEDYDWLHCNPQFRRGKFAFLHSFEQIAKSSGFTVARKQYYLDLLKDKNEYDCFYAALKNNQKRFEKDYQPPIPNWKDIPDLD